MSAAGERSAKDQNQWVFLTNEDCFELTGDEENSPTMCRLRHPKTDAACLAMFTHEDRKLYEITQFHEEYRSWFIGNTVQEDGSLFMTVPADPVYYILPYLIKASQSGKFIPLDQMMQDDDYPECSRLCQCDGVCDLEQVADVKGNDDFRAYRYNKNGTLSWLRLKVEKVADTLESKRINVSDGAQVDTFVQSSKSPDTTRDEYIRYAHGLVSDYLPVSLGLELKTFLGIKDIVHEKPVLKESLGKRPKAGAVEPTEDYSSRGVKNEVKSSNKKLSAAQRKLSKVDTSGMRTMASFFGKPRKA